MDTSWLLILPLALLYVVLLATALAEWVHNPRSRHLNRWIWLPIILFVSLLGPAAYLLLGRSD
ncbi:MAG: negative regulator of sigma-Y activity [Anaerolineae bacterium]|nr:negative regulator of sigma-Y activity [Anaerolineae bacterium]